MTKSKRARLAWTFRGFKCSNVPMCQQSINLNPDDYFRGMRTFKLLLSYSTFIRKKYGLEISMSPTQLLTWNNVIYILTKIHGKLIQYSFNVEVKFAPQCPVATNNYNVQVWKTFIGSTTSSWVLHLHLLKACDSGVSFQKYRFKTVEFWYWKITQHISSIYHPFTYSCTQNDAHVFALRED